MNTAGDVHLHERPVGPDHPPYIVAEVGINHNGKQDRALQLLRKSAGAGVDAVKFQVYRTDDLVSPAADPAPYQKEQMNRSLKSQRNLLGRMELPFSFFEELAGAAREEGVDFLATPFDLESLSFLETLDPPAIKIGSGDLTNHQLLGEVQKTDRPVILSTGMASFEEIDRAIEVLRPDYRGEGPNQKGESPRDLVVLYCVSLYPAPFSSFDLRTIETYRSRYGIPVGFSDHSTGMRAAEIATALGSCLFEKHVTLDRTDEGPDHAASLEIPELFDYVERIQTAYKAIGSGEKEMTEEELEMRNYARRSVGVRRNVDAGETLSADDLVALRPATGIPASDFEEVIGRTAAESIRAGTILQEKHLQSS